MSRFHIIMKPIKHLNSNLTLTILSFSFVFLISCGANKDEVVLKDDPDTSNSSSPNILLIIADDMGLDATNGYTEGSQKPTTPHIDSIMNAGLKFDNVWVNPTCSPTRSSIITGKYGYNTGVLTAGDVLSSQHEVLQAYINKQTGNKYATAVVGKWHLAKRNFNPETLGIDYYTGLISGTADSYTSWSLTEDGSSTNNTTYVTQKFTDLAMNWVSSQEKPWFLWLAYTAPHTPFHLPPSKMHSQGALPSDATSIDANPLPYYLASIEAMDYQIGRLLDSISKDELANTVIIFIGDNGPTSAVAQAPYSRGKTKGTIYQGGIHVPMFICGSSVRVGTEESLINGTDLYATIAGLAGVQIEEIHNSKNFGALLKAKKADFREYIYSERKGSQKDSDSWCIRNKSYKLIESADGSQELYDMTADPYETNNLLNGTLTTNETTAKSNLEKALTNIRK